MAVKKATKQVDTEAKEVVSRVYEVGYHISPEVKEDELESVVGGIRSVIEKGGGSFIAESAPSLMKLAYPIETHVAGKIVEHDRAYFGWLKFEASAEVAHSLESALKASRDIIRSIVFRTVREDTRAQFKAPQLREVKRTDTLRPTARRTEETAAPISEAELDKAIEGLTNE